MKLYSAICHEMNQLCLSESIGRERKSCWRRRVSWRHCTCQADIWRSGKLADCFRRIKRLAESTGTEREDRASNIK